MPAWKNEGEMFALVNESLYAHVMGGVLDGREYYQQIPPEEDVGFPFMLVIVAIIAVIVVCNIVVYIKRRFL